MKTNILGLPVKESELLVKELNVLLSNFQVYYQNLRGIHWNIRGKRFFDLHVKFEELYNDSQLKIDMIAERVLTLGGTPLHTFSDYLDNLTNLILGCGIYCTAQAIYRNPFKAIKKLKAIKTMVFGQSKAYLAELSEEAKRPVIII